MSLSTGKYLHASIRIEQSINDQLIQMVKDLATKDNHPEITKGYPIFEWIPGNPITYKDKETQNEDNEI